jgi:hypothetical protein
MRVVLTRKLAERIDGIDLTGKEVGDVFELSDAAGRLLLAEQWAVIERRAVARPPKRQYASVAADYWDHMRRRPGAMMPPEDRLAVAADRARERGGGGEAVPEDPE